MWFLLSERSPCGSAEGTWRTRITPNTSMLSSLLPPRSHWDSRPRFEVAALAKDISCTLRGVIWKKMLRGDWFWLLELEGFVGQTQKLHAAAKGCNCCCCSKSSECHYEKKVLSDARRAALYPCDAGSSGSLEIARPPSSFACENIAPSCQWVSSHAYDLANNSLPIAGLNI